jgi:ferredoxin
MGSLYCNTFCPVGSFLGFISKFSIFIIKFDEVKCTSCGKCAVVCKSLCIDVKQKSIDVSRCVDCFNCISVCPEGAIKFQRERKKPVLHPSIKIVSEPTDMNKRNFIVGSVTSIIGTLSLSNVLKANSISGAKKPTVIKNEKSCYPSPPGSVSLVNMNNNCIACHLCVSACPTNVLQPSFLQYGLTAMMQPYMDYNVNYCNFECTKCGDICPTGAILPVSKNEKKTLQIGKVTFIKENCVVFTENTACGSCSEHCPTQAVHMVPYKDNITIPEVNPDICIGCGACEHACPTRPYRAIFVNGNLVHEIAQKPKTDKMEKANPEEDFPF